MQYINILGDPKLIFEFEEFAEANGFETDLKLKDSSLKLDGNDDMYIHLLSGIGAPIVTLITNYLAQHFKKRKIKVVYSKGAEKKEIEIEGASISEMNILLKSANDIASLEVLEKEVE